MRQKNATTIFVLMLERMRKNLCPKSAYEQIKIAIDGDDAPNARNGLLWKDVQCNVMEKETHNYIETFVKSNDNATEVINKLRQQNSNINFHSWVFVEKIENRECSNYNHLLVFSVPRTHLGKKIQYCARTFNLRPWRKQTVEFGYEFKNWHRAFF